MFLENNGLIHIAIIILGACGFLVAKHIYDHKRKGKALICPVRFDCNTVVNSDYSKIFGVPVEFLGMLYYSLIILCHIILIFYPTTFSILPFNLPLVLSTIAFMFSVYLVSILFFVLKKGCSWCFVSATVSTIIFIFTLIVL